MISSSFLEFCSFSAYKNNNYLQKRAIKQHTFFIYKKKVVILCPILRLVCEASSMLDENEANK